MQLSHLAIDYALLGLSRTIASDIAYKLYKHINMKRSPSGKNFTLQLVRYLKSLE